MRNICDVIPKLIAALPDGHGVISVLQKIASKAIYAAPEAQWKYWFSAMVALNTMLPDPDAEDAPDWAKNVQAIFANKVQ